MTPFGSLSICKGFKRVKETQGEASGPLLYLFWEQFLLIGFWDTTFLAFSLLAPPVPEDIFLPLAPQKNTHTHTHTHTHEVFLKNQFRRIFKTLQRNPDSSPVYKETGDLTRTIFPDLSSFHSPLAHCTPRHISLLTHTMHALAPDLDLYLSHCLKQSSSSFHDSILLAFRSQFTDCHR